MILQRGSDKSTLDDKGRVNIPVRFREFFQGKLIITRGQERCVWIMTPVLWERLEQAEGVSEELPQEEWEAFVNKYLSQAEETELDKAGRIAIPQIIREYANLTKDCIVNRDRDRLSIWDRGIWDAYLTENNPLANAAMNKLGQDIFRAKQGRE